MNESNLHNYQNFSVDHVVNNSFSALLLDMGLGKTVSTLTAANKLIFEDLEVDKILVIAPKRVAEHVWSAEIQKWDHLKHLEISCVVGTAKQRHSALKADADIYIIGRDNTAWLCGLYGGSMLPFDMLVVDESSSFKNPKSVRFKALKKVQPSFKRVVLLTGTPAPNGLYDLWAQLYLLDRGERLGKTQTAFKEKYFTNVSRSNQYEILRAQSKKHAAKIHKRISDICISMKAKDYLDLKERQNNYIEIKLPKEVQKKYKDFEREKVLELFAEHKEGETISALNAAALSNKLLQFANGAVYDELRDYHVVHDLKLDATEEIVENACGKPVLIAYTYKHDLYRLQKRLKKYKPRTLTSNKDIDDWNAGKIQILIMHPASGGHGLNLQSGGNIIVWFGQTWALELYQQLNSRLDRQGQLFAVIIHHLIALGTMDEKVISKGKHKAARQDGLLDAVKALIKEYTI